MFAESEIWILINDKNLKLVDTSHFKSICIIL